MDAGAEETVSGSSYNGFVWSEHQRAYNWLKREWAAGRRVKVGPECNVCGQRQGYLMTHSEDYSAPYGEHIGQWSLYYWCHMLIQCRFRAEDVPMSSGVPHLVSNGTSVVYGNTAVSKPASVCMRTAGTSRTCSTLTSPSTT
jgi:hypothetical protein